MSFSTYAQEKVDPQVEKLEFSGADGFSSLPFTKFAAKVETGKPVVIEGISVKIKTHTLRKPVFVSTELCSVVGNNELPLLDPGELLRVKEFVSYELAARTFAYEVNYEFFDAESGEEIGAARQEFYVDETGNGNFVIKCVKDFTLDAVPLWVKKLRE
ncbi:MAG: hypothetical protein ABI878_06750 [Acidobacteriota bacterium]